ncbi:hypothetical protein TIFTF001_050856 [Ficus carica]|uniref:Uncharacterized protein n=1 Tax=Ficus carica TaxID=3494 RepID=A0AA88CJK0_FICCA|nr:hypothetical protein TIFTF001_050856 [Ficus carica]
MSFTCAIHPGVIVSSGVFRMYLIANLRGEELEPFLCGAKDKAKPVDEINVLMCLLVKRLVQWWGRAALGLNPDWACRAARDNVPPWTKASLRPCH